MRLGLLLRFTGSGALLLACSANVVETDPTGGGGSGASAATGATSTTGSSSLTGAGGSPVGCPPAPPAEGQVCPKPELVCSYGDSPFSQCRTSAVCLASGWTVFVPPPDCDFDPSCPPMVPPPQSICPSEGAHCAFPDGTQCACTTCLGGPCGPPPPVWVCSSPAPGCPVPAPNAGAACSQAGLACVYGDPCNGGLATSCDGISWSWESVACPL